jgi:hypothetical protein
MDITILVLQEKKMITKIVFIINLILFIFNVVFAICTKIKGWSTWYYSLIPASYSFIIVLAIILITNQSLGDSLCMNLSA